FPSGTDFARALFTSAHEFFEPFGPRRIASAHGVAARASQKQPPRSARQTRRSAHFLLVVLSHRTALLPNPKPTASTRRRCLLERSRPRIHPRHALRPGRR